MGNQNQSAQLGVEFDPSMCREWTEMGRAHVPVQDAQDPLLVPRQVE